MVVTILSPLLDAGVGNSTILLEKQNMLNVTVLVDTKLVDS